MIHDSSWFCNLNKTAEWKAFLWLSCLTSSRQALTHKPKAARAFFVLSWDDIFAASYWTRWMRAITIDCTTCFGTMASRAQFPIQSTCRLLIDFAFLSHHHHHHRSSSCYFASFAFLSFHIPLVERIQSKSIKKAEWSDVWLSGSLKSHNSLDPILKSKVFLLARVSLLSPFRRVWPSTD